MKILVLMLLVAFVGSSVSSESGRIEKRSPGDLYYLYDPARRSNFQGRTRGFPGSFNFRGRPGQRFWIEIDDDLFDDRRKRQVAHASSGTRRVKRSPDDFFDDDNPLFHPMAGLNMRGFTNPFSQARTRFASSAFKTPRFFVDFDDMFDDRRKRQAVSGVNNQRGKRSVFFGDNDDYDDDDYYFIPSTRFNTRGSVRPFSQGRTRGASTLFNFKRPVTPRRYFVDFDDLYDDRRKRQA